MFDHDADAGNNRGQRWTRSASVGGTDGQMTEELGPPTQWSRSTGAFLTALGGPESRQLGSGLKENGRRTTSSAAPGQTPDEVAGNEDPPEASLDASGVLAALATALLVGVIVSCCVAGFFRLLRRVSEDRGGTRQVPSRKACWGSVVDVGRDAKQAIAPPARQASPLPPCRGGSAENGIVRKWDFGPFRSPAEAAAMAAAAAEMLGGGPLNPPGKESGVATLTMAAPPGAAQFRTSRSPSTSSAGSVTRVAPSSGAHEDPTNDTPQKGRQESPQQRGRQYFPDSNAAFRASTPVRGVPFDPAAGDPQFGPFAARKLPPRGHSGQLAAPPSPPIGRGRSQSDGNLLWRAASPRSEHGDKDDEQRSVDSPSIASVSGPPEEEPFTGVKAKLQRPRNDTSSFFMVNAQSNAKSYNQYYPSLTQRHSSLQRARSDVSRVPDVSSRSVPCRQCASTADSTQKGGSTAGKAKATRTAQAKDAPTTRDSKTAHFPHWSSIAMRFPRFWQSPSGNEGPGNSSSSAATASQQRRGKKINPPLQRRRSDCAVPPPNVDPSPEPPNDPPPTVPVSAAGNEPSGPESKTGKPSGPRFWVPTRTSFFYRFTSSQTQSCPPCAPSPPSDDTPSAPSVAEAEADLLVAPVTTQLDQTRNQPLAERKRIFKELQRQLHPDKNVDNSEAAKLAFQKLMQHRAAYLIGV